MFKNLLDFWRGKDFLSEVLKEFEEMLNDAQDMYKSVCKKLIYSEEVSGLKEKVYSVDRRINELQKDIRKRIVEHLSLRPTIDLPVSLILMSVVKDAERLGDYCKNLFEVTNLLEKPMDINRYSSLFDELDGKILELFEQTKKAFKESDERGAKLTWQYERDIVKKCDKIIENLAKSELSANESVCFTLIARHFKRISAHLANIGTSVILPISDLDYFDERRKR